ncbi:hypothetical protein J7443_12155 [Tropicibacter sp. R15_0]|uniref:hypothetical protein n=1 Tax=Tropicibacter sp. R15_0 TaxID=2821101 RepID=UPI001ADAC20D|nr:hypothetical protein [Tropicibacter sp. R15_0]MBO9465988.1 hypothetical protein [Tropicibacter sp. R15_0]
MKRLARLKPENGPKQVILTQRAAAHWRLGQTQDAVTLFRLARESELDWGGRKRRDVSEYLVEYCAYCVNLIQHDATADENLEAQFERLKALAVADIVKDDFMPMPCSPTGKVY